MPLYPEDVPALLRDSFIWKLKKSAAS